MERLTFEGNFCDIAQCREMPCQHGSNCFQKQIWERLKAYEDAGVSPAACKQAMEIENGLNADGSSIARMVELMNADKEGRVFVLPCKMGETMINATFPERPNLMKRISLAVSYEQKGCIYHMEYNAFTALMECGQIRPVSEETERVLGGDTNE